MRQSAAPILLALLALSSACYIQNCPRGGRRALPEPRQCLSCGPGAKGRCFGPSVCCGDGMGCYVGSPETTRCLEENYLPSPCETGGKTCGTQGGHCAAPGLCCNTEGCVMDTHCSDDVQLQSSDEQQAELMDVSPGQLLLKLLRVNNGRQTHF